MFLPHICGVCKRLVRGDYPTQALLSNGLTVLGKISKHPPYTPLYISRGVTSKIYGSREMIPVAMPGEILPNIYR